MAFGYFCHERWTIASAFSDVNHEASARTRHTRRSDRQRGSRVLLLDVITNLITLDPETSAIPVIVASAGLQALAGRDAELADRACM
jgi:hypothetical protein